MKKPVGTLKCLKAMQGVESKTEGKVTGGGHAGQASLQAGSQEAGAGRRVWKETREAGKQIRATANTTLP